MKTNRALFIISAIIRLVISSMGIFLFSMVFVLQDVLTEAMLENMEPVNEFIQTLVSADPKTYGYLLNYSNQQCVDYMMGFAKALFGVLLVIAIVWFVFGIINLLLSKKCKYEIEISLGKKIAIAILSWILSGGFLCNVLTTIALFLKRKDNVSRLYDN